MPLLNFRNKSAILFFFALLLSILVALSAQAQPTKGLAIASSIQPIAGIAVLDNGTVRVIRGTYRHGFERSYPEANLDFASGKLEDLNIYDDEFAVPLGVELTQSESKYAILEHIREGSGGCYGIAKDSRIRIIDLATGLTDSVIQLGLRTEMLDDLVTFDLKRERFTFIASNRVYQWNIEQENLYWAGSSIDFNIRYPSRLANNGHFRPALPTTTRGSIGFVLGSISSRWIYEVPTTANEIYGFAMWRPGFPAKKNFVLTDIGVLMVDTRASSEIIVPFVLDYRFDAAVVDRTTGNFLCVYREGTSEQAYYGYATMTPDSISIIKGNPYDPDYPMIFENFIQSGRNHTGHTHYAATMRVEDSPISFALATDESAEDIVNFPTRNVRLDFADLEISISSTGDTTFLVHPVISNLDTTEIESINMSGPSLDSIRNRFSCGIQVLQNYEGLSIQPGESIQLPPFEIPSLSISRNSLTYQSLISLNAANGLPLRFGVNRKTVASTRLVSKTTDISENSDILIYPIPTHHNLHIQQAKSKTHIFTHAKIIDITGRVIAIKKIMDNTVDLSDIHSGLYIIEINSEDNRSFKKKLLIE